MKYQIEQLAAGNNWGIRGPGVALGGDLLFSREDAQSVATMLERAFAAGQENIRAELGRQEREITATRFAAQNWKSCTACEGTGRQNFKLLCPKCYGIGKVP